MRKKLSAVYVRTDITSTTGVNSLSGSCAARRRVEHVVAADDSERRVDRGEEPAKATSPRAMTKNAIARVVRRSLRR